MRENEVKKESPTNKKSIHKEKVFDWSTLDIPMTKISSSKDIINRIMDFTSIHVHRVGKRDKVDKEFIEKLANLKNHNGLISHLTKSLFQEKTIDKLLTYHRLDTNMHVKIDKNLLPKK